MKQLQFFRLSVAAAIAAAVLTVGAAAGAKTFWDQVNESAPRSIFDDSRDATPRSIFDDSRDVAPVHAPDVDPGRLTGE